MKGRLNKIYPVERIEGNGNLIITLDERERILGITFSAAELRGFENICIGRMIWEMPGITSRICGICSVSHTLASVLAAENVLNAKVPETAVLQRTLLNFGQIIYSHIEQLFLLSSPEWLKKEGIKDIIDLVKRKKELFEIGLAVKKTAYNLITEIGGSLISPATVIPGGMTKALTIEAGESLYKIANESLNNALKLFEVILDGLNFIKNKNQKFDNITNYFLFLGSKFNPVFMSDKVFIIDNKLAHISEFEVCDYKKHIIEGIREYSHSKFPYLASKGYPEGIYTVGPIARFLGTEKYETNNAERCAKVLRSLVNNGNLTGYFNAAIRGVEIVYAIEKSLEILHNKKLFGREYRIKVERREGRGVGAVEAPRGTLIHEYECDDLGKVTYANFIVATTHNSSAINYGLELSVSKFKGEKISDVLIKEAKEAVRNYDPCLSCATHIVKVKVEKLINKIDVINETT